MESKIESEKSGGNQIITPKPVLVVVPIHGVEGGPFQYAYFDRSNIQKSRSPPSPLSQVVTLPQ